MAARGVLDEFTAPAAKAALLERSRGRIEALFGVSLAVLGALGAEDPLPARIWLQLRGARGAVHSAKVSPGRGRAGCVASSPCPPARRPALPTGSGFPPRGLTSHSITGKRATMPREGPGGVGGVAGLFKAGHGGALGRLRQEDCEFQASLGYAMSLRPA